MVGLLEAAGRDPWAVLDRAGVDRFGLMDPAYSISIEQELQVLRQLRQQLPAPGLSLRLARAYRLRGFSVLGLAMQAAANPLAMLQLIMRYPRLAWGAFAGELRIEGRHLILAFEPQPRLGPLEGFLAERDSACALQVVEEARQAPLPLRRVRFRHAGDPGPFEAFFRCPVAFRAGRTELVCDREAMLQPLPQADPMVCSFYSAQCERMSRDLDEPFRYADAVRRRLLGADPMPDIAGRARQMLLSPRTLQRRLAQEDCRYSELLRETRKVRASEMLRDSGQPLEKIAAVLGYRDAVAFSHAFKDWTGSSPRSWRRAALDSATAGA